MTIGNSPAARDQSWPAAARAGEPTRARRPEPGARGMNRRQARTRQGYEAVRGGVMSPGGGSASFLLLLEWRMALCGRPRQPPIAAAKTCIAVEPWTACWLTLGRVTYLTVFPDCSGTPS